MIDAALQAALCTLAGDALGKRFTDARLAAVSGGDINTALRLSAGEHTVFIKLRPATDIAMFEAEADGLAALAICPAVRIPRVLFCGETAGQAVLMLEWLDLHPLRSDTDGRTAGAALAALHRCLGERYGWPRDNFLGRTPQTNHAHDNWPRFFVEQRLQPQFAAVARQGFGGELQRHGERLMERTAALFLEYRPAPSLLHGDLWHGNVGMLDSGQPVLFDPAVHHGDRECDLAMSELFGGFPLSFYAAYRQSWPLDSGYEQRKPLYTLYHVLNHLQLFGRSYLAQAERMSAALARELAR